MECKLREDIKKFYELKEELYDEAKELELDTCDNNVDIIVDIYFSHNKWIDEDEEMFKSFIHKIEVCNLLTNKEDCWITTHLKEIKDFYGGSIKNTRNWLKSTFVYPTI